MTRRLGAVGAMALGVTIGWACDGATVGRMLHDAGGMLMDASGGGGGSGGGSGGGPSDASAQMPTVRTAACDTQLPSGAWIATVDDPPISPTDLGRVVVWGCEVEGTPTGDAARGECVVLGPTRLYEGSIEVVCGNGDIATNGVRYSAVTFVFD